ncbi:uncharacterized protein SPAPADRAFT_143279 [Spathaspora passalidarum NRRL Y-27907]|uniref:Zinc finger PHD-type domain-containing protein n=1 Tax=Spathaspora passalidarum (strain NRRL Y-27907 / 11-Y1) TaxID=619300 RepID=G3AUQ0_SPAPN|nr:uncharacterized protein SPAPADRAFT_143279 [Spathaspora passalidarum NRRL Y-27907]EGW30606.1 hypothetical protein SPAPADRAFT_143279 [Spathaspora passalidarum NRRL Y-27907]
MSRRSGRKTYTAEQPSTAAPAQTFPEEEELEDLEEDSLEEGDEVTRCVCGNDELQTDTINKELEDLLAKEYKIKIDHGLFIQCDKCGVWQHGYCVGLFDNNDVPEKYWCELCKPEVHIFIDKRTLYKPVNDRRRKVEQISMIKKKNSGSSSGSSRNSPPTGGKRKRHHHEEDEYDYEVALQKALRESAKESGVPVDEANQEVKQKLNDHDTSNVDEENDVSNSDAGSKRAARSRGGRAAKSKKKKKKDATSLSSSSSTSNANSGNTNTGVTKEELINQPSKPRFVSSKSSIYELRKRTGAILEWLGRSQIELEDEKVRKLELFNFTPNSDDLQVKQDVENVQTKFNENLELMEKLTEQILIWEQRFGKYAP